MIRTFLITLGLCLFVACVNQEKDSHDRAEADSVAAGSLGSHLELPSERLVAPIPFECRDLGMLLIWDEAEINSSERIPLNHSGYGSSHALRICSLRIYNFSDSHADLPRIEDLGLEVSIDDKRYPLQSLTAYASEFMHQETLSLLEGNYPQSGLPGKTWTQVYLAGRISTRDLLDVRPAYFFMSDGIQRPWLSVHLEKLEAFLQKPSRNGFHELAGTAWTTQADPDGTE
ncbi:MAG: hypothetical protein ABIK28_24435 [Planctomycetota bacterium]